MITGSTIDLAVSGGSSLSVSTSGRSTSELSDVGEIVSSPGSPKYKVRIEGIANCLYIGSVERCSRGGHGLPLRGWHS